MLSEAARTPVFSPRPLSPLVTNTVSLLTTSTLPSVAFFLSSLKHLILVIVQSLKQLCKKCVSVDVMLFLVCQGFIKREITQWAAVPIEDHLRPLASHS